MTVYMMPNVDPMRYARIVPMRILKVLRTDKLDNCTKNDIRMVYDVLEKIDSPPNIAYFHHKHV